MQFAFRWMNCLLMREISVQNTVRMWDTYLAEGPDAFSQFHLYVCSAFLVKWSDKLREMDFQGIIMFLQSLPTQGWGDHEIEITNVNGTAPNAFYLDFFLVDVPKDASGGAGLSSATTVPLTATGSGTGGGSTASATSTGRRSGTRAAWASRTCFHSRRRGRRRRRRGG